MPCVTGPDTDRAPRTAGQAFGIDPKKTREAAKVDPFNVTIDCAGTAALHVVTFYQFGEFRQGHVVQDDHLDDNRPDRFERGWVCRVPSELFLC
jgi:hypothetical protein